MQSISNRDLGKGSVVTSPFWWTSSEMHMPHSSVSKNLNLGMSSPDHLYPAGKQLGQPLHEQDSSSTQSAGESYQEVAGSMACNTYGQFLRMSTGTGGKRVDKKLKPKFSIETPEGAYSAANHDHNQPGFRVSYASADPYLMPNYGQHAIMHPQMMSITSSRRVPLPLDWPDEGPVYVNAKQYRGILRRRELRAKLEAQNKHAKGRKPYLHESRHLHAMKRVRGSGGRFLNTKQLQQDNQQQQLKLPVPNADKMKFSVHSTGPQVPSISNDMFQLPDPLRFGEFHSNMSGGMHGDIAGRIIMMENSSSREVPFIR